MTKPLCLLVAASMLVLVLAPCTLSARSTTFTLQGTPCPATCLTHQHATLGCIIDIR